MPNSIRNIAWTYRLLIVAIITIRSATAAVENPSPAQMQTGSLLMRMQHGYVAATVLNTDVNISINGLVARVSLMQEFKNEHSEWVEGVYVFPLPDKAAVDHMRLHIGDRIIEGEIQEKDKARKEYEQAKLAGKKTSLVEQQRANLFTTSVANIGPGETVIVEIEYLEDVRYDDGTFSLRFPMTLTPRFIPGQALPDKQGSGWSPDASLITPPMVSASAGHRVTLQATVNAGMPLEIIASRYHPVNVHEASGRYVVTFPDGQVPMDHDFELLWRPVPSSAPRAMAFSETINGEPHFLFMVMPPEAGAPVAAPVPREMIFIIDTSGSMHGVSIQQAKRALGRALDGLKTGDRFNVIEFNSYHHALFPTSVSADPSRIAAAKRFVRSLQANGGTNMQPALEFALQSAPAESYLRQIVFITDGAVGNEEGLYQLIEANLGSSRLFTVGIGSAAEAGRGTFTIISALHEVGEKMDRLFRKLEQPQVTNIQMHWPGGAVVDTYPSLVPDLYLGEPVTVRAKSAHPFEEHDTVRISGDSIGGGWSSDLALGGDEQSSGVGALWARARIAALLDMARRGADAKETRRSIVKTALAHHLVSKYTSLVAVDKTPTRPSGDPLLSEQVPNLMPYGQSGAAIFGFPATATNAPAMRLTGLAALLVALLLLAATALQRKRCHGLAY